MNGCTAETPIQNADENSRRYNRTSQSPKRAGERLSLLNGQNPSIEPQHHQREPLSTTTISAEQVPHIYADETSDQSQGRKRKRSCSGSTQPKRVKTCASLESAGTASRFITDGCGLDNQNAADPVAYWASEQRWPINFAHMSQVKSDSSKKRPPSSSYSQSYRAGEVPRAHSRPYEALLAQNGLHMDESKGRQLVSQESKSLCEKLLQVSYPEPEHTPYPLSKFADVWQRVQSHNEARLFRDITPLLIPSPELLYIGGHQELEHVAETLSVEWTNVKTLCGPMPKPDQVIGPTQSAFDDEQVAKLNNHTSFERATLFGENVYFPFLLIEAKSGENGINKADRQNMHSCSIALNALLQLYLALDDGRKKAAALNGEILLFSISHDNERVKLFGHFALVEAEKISFYRYYFEEFVLNLEARQGRKRTHDFVRAVYDVFYPTHLSRICNALAEMQDPRDVSISSNMSFDETNSRELAPSVPSSQEASLFKVPTTPASMTRKSEVDLLREQMAEQQRQLTELLADQQRQSREQLAEQQRQTQEQLDLLRGMLAEQQKYNRERMAQ